MLNLEVFKKNYLVSGLSDEQIDRIAALATPKKLSAGETLIQYGHTGGEFFVVLAGRVNVLTNDGDKLAEVGPGQVLGEIELFDARPRSAHAVCVGLVDVAVIPTKELRALLSADKALGFTVLCNLARVLTMRLRNTNEKLDALYDQVQGPWHHAL